MPRIATLIPVLLGIACTATHSLADASNEKFLDGLLQRRLFTLAQRHCQDQLARTDLSSRQRVEHNVNLSRTYSEWALNSPVGQRQTLWRQAHAAVDELVVAEPKNPFLLLALRQASLVHLAEGKLACYEAQSTSDPTALTQTARKALQQAVSSLDDVLVQVTEQLDGRGKVSDGPRLTASELAILQRRVRDQLADALLNQALCYAERSADRINSLQRAEQHLRLLAADTNPIEWRSRVTLLTCWRELGRVGELRERAEHYLSSEPPPDAAAGIQIELARQLMAEGKHNEALGQLGGAVPRSPSVAAERDFVELEILLAAAAVQSDTKIAGLWRRRAVDQVEKIEQRHSAYWMRRAEGLMGRHVAAAPTDDNLDLLVRAAQGLYRAGKFDDALNAYDRAHKRALENGDSTRAFQLAYTAAMIEHDRQHYAEASQRFVQVALADKQHSRAAEAHLMAAFNIAQQIRQQPTPDVQTYVDVLKEHLDNWPEAATANQARFWLGRILQSQRQWRQAIDVLRRISPTSEQYPASLSITASCYRQWFEQLSAQDEPGLAKRAVEAADYFERVARKLLDDSAPNQAATIRLAAGWSARFRMRYGGRGFGGAEKLVQDVLNSQDSATAEQLTPLRILLVYALAAQPGQLEQAQHVLNETVGGSPDELLVLVDGLSEALSNAAPVARRRLAELQLRCVAMLKPSRQQLSPPVRLDLDMAEAAALVIANRRIEALTAYKTLADNHPSNGEIQSGYADLLLAGGDRASWQAALEKWREIERRSRPNSQRWFVAKYSQAKAHRQLDNPKQAARIIRLTQVLHPELGGPEMKARFLRLLALCEMAE